MSSTGFDIKRKTRPVSVQHATVRNVPVRTTTPIVAAPIQHFHSKKSQHFGTLKTSFIAIAAAIATFGFSIATSQVMAHMNANSAANAVVSSDAQVIPLADAAIRTTPATPSGLAVTENPDVAALSTDVITDPNAIYLPEEKMDVPDPLTQRKAFLTTYLQSKHSPLATHVDALSEQTQWKLIIAISNSESSYCKRNMLNNCWGIGGAWNLKAYDNYDQAIADVNRLLEQKYVAAGLDSPDKIEQKWVGHPNDNWDDAANQVMDDLKDVQ